MAWSWNDDFEDGTHDELFADLTAGSLYRAFLAAVNERLQATNNSTISTPAAGGLVLQVGGTSSWAGLQSQTASVISSFLRNRDGSDVEIELDGATWTNNTTPLFEYWSLATILAAGGWRRKYPREITSTGAAGTDGQKARLSCTPASSSADKLLSGRVFLRSGGVWVIQAEGTDPDLIETTGAIQAGDYFGGWILNDIRDVLNRLVWTMSDWNLITTGGIGQAVGVMLGTMTYGTSGTLRRGSDASTAAAEAEFDLPTDSAGVEPRMQTYKIGSTFVIDSMDGNAIVEDLPVISGRDRNVEFFAVIFGPSYSNSIAFFDDQGYVAVQGWHKACRFDMVTTAAADATSTNLFGDHTHRPDTWPTFAGGDVARGWSSVHVAVAKWDIATGFAWSALTT